MFEELESKIDFEDTLIRIHAINEEGYTFFTGVHDEFIEFIERYITETNEMLVRRLKSKLEEENITSVNEILNIIEKILNDEFSDFNNVIDNFRFNEMYSASKSIEFIPNKLLCILSDEIIRLTALKQRISFEEEYVSMNSHISLMTKANGFKWVKLDDEII